MRISDWSSDVCSSDLIFHQLVEAGGLEIGVGTDHQRQVRHRPGGHGLQHNASHVDQVKLAVMLPHRDRIALDDVDHQRIGQAAGNARILDPAQLQHVGAHLGQVERSEEHTSELQSLMRISYAVFCLKKQKNK